jgi:hypothetical protein
MASAARTLVPSTIDAKHRCLQCWKFGHDKSAHACTWCLDAHTTDKHICRLCAWVGHCDYPINEFRIVVLTKLKSLPCMSSIVVLLPTIVGYLPDLHQQCLHCKESFYRDSPEQSQFHTISCPYCHKCGHTQFLCTARIEADRHHQAILPQNQQRAAYYSARRHGN